jgi:hypothetical protein
VPAVALVLDLPPGVVLLRNRQRPDRTVDPDVVVRHLGLLRASLDGGAFRAEGWAAVTVIRDAVALDELAFERVPLVAPAAAPGPTPIPPR